MQEFKFSFSFLPLLLKTLASISLPNIYNWLQRLKNSVIALVSISSFLFLLLLPLFQTLRTSSFCHNSFLPGLSTSSSHLYSIIRLDFNAKEKTTKEIDHNSTCFKIVEFTIDRIENLKLQKCISKNEWQV